MVLSVILAAVEAGVEGLKVHGLSDLSKAITQDEIVKWSVDIAKQYSIGLACVMSLLQFPIARKYIKYK